MEDKKKIRLDKLSIQIVHENDTIVFKPTLRGMVVPAWGVRTPSRMWMWPLLAGMSVLRAWASPLLKITYYTDDTINK